MADTVEWKWSFDTTNKTATYTKETTLEGNGEKTTETVFTISGFEAKTSGVTINADYLSANITVVAPSTANGNITVKKTLLENLKDGATLTLGSAYYSSSNDGYKLTVATSEDAISQVKKIKSGTIAVGNPENDGVSANVTATLEAYAESTTGETITYHAEKENQTIATITGLKKDQTANVSVDGTTIKLKEGALSGDVTLTPQTIQGLDTSVINPTALKLQLVTGDDLANTDAVGYGVSTGWLANGTSNTAVYQTTKAEGWTTEDNYHIKHDTAVTKDIATITGFKGNVQYYTAGASANANKVMCGTSEAVKVEEVKDGSDNLTGYKFYVFEGALGTGTNPNDVTITKGDGAGTLTTALALGKEENNSITETTEYGFTNKNGENTYWDVTSGTVSRKYDVGAGWSIVNGAIHHTGATTETDIEITGTGLTSKTNQTADAIKTSGIEITTAAVAATADPAVAAVTGTISLGKDAFAGDGTTITITKGDYNLALATTPALTTELTADSDPALKIADTITSGTATIQGKTKEWFEAGNETGGNKSYTHHTAKTDSVFGTISGLPSDATKDAFVIADPTTSGEDTVYTIKLKDAALGTGTISLNLNNTSGQAGYIAGLKDSDNVKYELGFDDSLTKATAENTIDTTFANTLSFQNKKEDGSDASSSDTVASVTVTVGGKTRDWYQLDSSNKKTITYHAGENKNIATITGLKAGTTASAVGFGTKTDGTGTTTDYQKIVLGKDALGSGTIVLKGETVGTDSTTHGLTLAFDASIVNTEGAYIGKVGFGDSNKYWSMGTDDGVATYKYHTEEGWSLVAGKEIQYTAAATSNATEVLKINGLRKTGITLENQNTDDVSDDTIDGITVAADAASPGKYIVTLDASKVLNSTDFTTAYISLGSGTYSLALLDTDSDPNDKKVGFEKSDAYWRVDGTTAYYQYDVAEGWTLGADGKITYTDAKENTTGVVLAKIENLKSDFVGSSTVRKVNGTDVSGTYESITGISIDANGVITLAENVLNNTENATATLTLGDGVTTGAYKLALASGVSDITGVDPTYGIEYSYTSGDSGSATVMRRRAAGWVSSENNTVLTYKDEVEDTLATINGLNKDIAAYPSGASATAAEKWGLWEDGNFTEVMVFDATNKLVKLKNAALFTGSTSIADGTTSDTITQADLGYKLALIGDDGTADADGKFGFAESDKYWHKDGTTSTTAHYIYTVDEGWTLNDTGTDITYTAAKTADGADTAAAPKLATITNLKSLTNDDDLKNGIVSTVKGENGFTTVTLKTDILPTDGSVVAISDATYKLALDGDDGTGDDFAANDDRVGFGNEDGATKYWTITSGSAGNSDSITLQYDVKAGWTLNNNQITYTAAPAAKSVVTISGLKSGITDLATSNGETGKYSSINGIQYDATTNTFKLAESVLPTTSGGGVTITKLNATDSNTYKLAFDGTTGENDNDLTTLGFAKQNYKWVADTSDTTGEATYQYDTAQGWTLNEAGSEISYTAQVSNQPIAVVEGLKKDQLTANLNAGALTIDTPTASAETPGTITIAKSSVLDTSQNGNTITVTTGDYKLAVASGVANVLASTDPTIALDYTEANLGKATVEEKLDAGWYLNPETENTLTYKAKVDNTLATITGLKDGVSSSDISVDNTTKKISVKESALDPLKSIVTLENKTVGGVAYTLALEGSTKAIASKPVFGFENNDGATKQWAVGTDADAGKVFYQYTTGEGWTLDNNKITHSEEAVTKVATISGLKTDLTASGGTISGVTLGQDGKTITLSKDVLGQGDISLSGTGYTLALAGAVNNRVGFDNEDGATKYWKLNDDGKTVSYVYDVADGWEHASDASITYTAGGTKELAKITGLNVEGLEVGKKYTDAEIGITYNAGTFKLGAGVLGSDTISVANGTDKGRLAAFDSATYKLGFSGTTTVDGTKTLFGFEDGDNYWAIDGTTNTTVHYQHDVGEGWTLDTAGGNAVEIVYTKASDDTSTGGIKGEPVILATIEHLADGLSDDGGKISGIELGTDGKTITLSRDVLGQGAISLTKDGSTATSDYVLALKDAVDGTTTGTKVLGFEYDVADAYWATKDTEPDKGKAFYQYNVAEGWTLAADGKTVTYKGASNDDSYSGTKSDPVILATISGFKDDLKANNSDLIDGIVIDKETGVITISDMGVFDQTKDGTITLEPGQGVTSDAYKLALDSSLDQVAKVDTTDLPTAPSAAASSGVATINGKIKQYAELKDGKITYHKVQDAEAIATIEGLADSAATNLISIGTDGTITLKKDALKTENVTLKNNGIAGTPAYVLALDSTGIDKTANALADNPNYTVSKVENGKATITAITKAYYSVDYGGQSVTYTGEGTATAAEITGLSSNATTTDGDNKVSLAGNVITLKKDALGEGTIALVNKKVGTTDSHGLSLAFAEDELTDSTKADKTKAGFGNNGDAYWTTTKSGVATYKQDTAAGWELDTATNTITYVPGTTTELAVIRGLKGLSDKANLTTAEAEALGIHVVPPVSSDTDPTTFSLESKAIDTAEVTVTDLVADDKKAFALDLSGTTSTDSNSNKTLGFDSDADNKSYWVVENGTVKYQYNVDEGWTLNSETGKITYSAASTKNVFTITGLKGIADGTYKTSPSDAEKKAGVKAISDLDGISEASGTVTLGEKVLGENEITLTMGENVSGYKLSLGDSITSIGGATNSKAWVVDGNGTAKYQQTTGAKWTLADGADPTSISYTPAKIGDDAVTFATISGLNSSITADQLNASENKIIEIPGDATTGDIVLHKDALGTNGIVLTNGKNASNEAMAYTLKLGGDVPAASTKNYWTYSGTTGTYKQESTAGWALVTTGDNANKAISYTAAGKTLTLATLKNLQKGINFYNGDADTPATIEGVSVSDNTILIDDSALGTGTLTLTQGKDADNKATTYKLSYIGAKPTTKPADAAGWLVGGGTATLRQINGEYYTATDTSIKYNKAASTSGSQVYATVKGLSKTITADDLSITYTDQTNKDATKGGVIMLNADVLNRANVTLTKGSTGTGSSKVTFDYTLVLADDVGPTVEKSAWTLNKTTATMKGDLSEGYRLSSDASKVTYMKTQTNATLLTIAGLPTSVVCKNNKIYASDGTTEAFTVDEDGFVTIDKAILAAAPNKLTLKGNGYEFKELSSYVGTGNDTDTNYDSSNVYIETDTVVAGGTGSPAIDKGVNVWRVSGTTATYKRVIPAHYKLTNGNTLTYVKEADYKDSNNKSVVYATITGLAKGLTVDSDGQTVYDANGSEALSVNSKEITLSEAAVSTSVIKFTANTDGYKLAASSYVTTNPTAKATAGVWTVSGTTATLKEGTTAGWAATTSGSTTTYTKQNAKQTGTDTLTQITGLKKGLKPDTSTGAIDGISVSGTKVTVDSKVLPATGNKNTQVKSTKYTLDYAGNVAENAGEFWSVSGSNVTIKGGTNSQWELKDGVLTFLTNEKQSTALVTIKGLKKGLKVGSDGKIDGITITGKNIKLDSRVLGTTDVTVSDSSYSLALEDTGDYKVEAPKEKQPVWSISGTKAILKSATIAGYAVDGSKIKYTKPTTTSAIATIDGLKKGLKVGSDGKIDGIDDIGILSSGAVAENGAIKIDTNKVGDSKTIKLTSSKYTIALPDDDTGVTESEAAWTVSGTTASYKKAFAHGYAPKESSNNKELTYYNGTTASSTTLATISGLKKGLKVDATNGQIAGISVATDAVDSKYAITLDSSVLGTTNVTLTDSDSSKDYVLALQTDAIKPNPVVVSETGVKLTVDKNGDVLAYGSYTPKGYSVASDTSITYNGTASGGDTSGTPVATISGLKSGIKADANGQIAGITYSGDTKKTFTLSKDVLGTENIKLEGSGYKLALAETGITQSSGTTENWSVKDGAAVLTIKSETGGYTLENINKQSISYAAKGETKVVVSGLSKSDGLTQDTANKTISISSSTLGTASATSKTITVSDGYKLILSDADNPTWVVSGTTASYVQAAKNGWVCDGDTITPGTSKVLATITGLPASITATDFTSLTPATDGTITLPAKALNGNASDIKLTGSGYKLALPTRDINNTDYDWNPHTISDAVWSVTDGKTSSTAQLATGTTEGYTISSDGKTATYKAFDSSKGKVTAKVTGLKKGLTSTEVKTAFTGTTLTLTEDMLGDTNESIKLTGNGYKLALPGSVTKYPDTDPDSDVTWTLKGTTLTLKKVTDPVFTINTNGSEVKSTGKTEVTMATISGLPSGLTLNSAGTLDGITIDEANSKIKVSQDVLGTGTLSLTSNDYTFALADDVAIPSTTAEDYEWVYSGTTATLKEATSEGYTLTGNDKKISYVKPVTNKTVATLTGLAKGISAGDGAVDGVDFNYDTGVITVSEAALGTTNATLKLASGVNYTLDLDRANVVDDYDADITNGVSKWNFAGTTATYSKVTPEHYSLDGNTIKYNKEKANSTLATVNNLKSFDADNNFDESSKTVTLYADNLNNKSVTLTDTAKAGYVLDVDEQVSSPKVSEAKWTQSGQTATLKGTRTAGYTLDSDTTLTYDTQKANQVFASISGVTEKLDETSFDMDDETVTLYGNELADAVTVSGSFLADFYGYSDASISGSTGADKIAVNGSGLTISSGSGDDFVDLGTAGSNTLIYSGGNDVIANFTATGNNQDKLQITATGTPTAKYEDGDVIISVGNNTITLQDFSAAKVYYFDKNDVQTHVDVESADLLDSDNFLTADSKLGDLVNAGNDYKPGEFDATQDFGSDLTKLTKQSCLVSFTGNKK